MCKSIKSIINDYCLLQFTTEDEYRPYLRNVHLHTNGYLYATNLHSVIKTKAENCEKTYQPVEGFPDAEGVFSNHVSVKQETFDTDLLLHNLLQVQVHFRVKKMNCTKCKGEGTMVCDHCDSEYDCKKCKGTGKEDNPNYEMTFAGLHEVTFFEKRYNSHLLELVFRTAKFSGTKKIKVSNAEGTKGTVFTVGIFDILLMPKFVREEK